MKISTRGRYAIRLMIDIALNNENDRPLQLKDIARRQGISKRYLEQIVISLKNHSLLRGVSGKSGGYMLSRSPEHIQISEIIEAAIGPINIVDCVRDPDLCRHSQSCGCRSLYTDVNQRIRDSLEDFTLADITVRSRCFHPEQLEKKHLFFDSSAPDLCSSRHR